MVVRDQHVIYLSDAGLMSRGQDPVGVAALISWPTGIDEQRLAGWAHHQSRLAAFHVDKINLQGLTGLGLGPGVREKHDEDTKTEDGQHSTHSLAPDRETLGKIMPRREDLRQGCFPVAWQSARKARMSFLLLRGHHDHENHR